MNPESFNPILKLFSIPGTITPHSRVFVHLFCLYLFIYLVIYSRFLDKKKLLFLVGQDHQTEKDNVFHVLMKQNNVGKKKRKKGHLDNEISLSETRVSANHGTLAKLPVGFPFNLEIK
jgi:hypothetical protein